MQAQGRRKKCRQRYYISRSKWSIRPKCVIKRNRDSSEMLRARGRSFESLNRIDQCACARAIRSRSQYEAEDSIKRWKRRKIRRGLSKARNVLSLSLSLSLYHSRANFATWRMLARSPRKLSGELNSLESFTIKCFPLISLITTAFRKLSRILLANVTNRCFKVSRSCSIANISKYLRLDAS